LFLRKNKYVADYYHAGLSIRERARKQNAWSKGLVRIIVATNAFGMGIDKPDVRFVVHMDLPDTLEAYFQEAGRGGRDERRAYAVLLYENADIHSLRQNFENSFPPLNTIKNVYEALSNYFQIPVGVGEGLSFDFDNNAFAATYQLKPLLTYHALKFIEKAGLITFTDPYANASKVFIRASREDLYKFQVEYANYDYLIKLLLRSYSGLFTNFTRIYETELAKRSNQSVDNIVTTLKKIEEYEIIDYHQQTEQPRVVFLENRLDIKYFSLSEEIYEERKQEAKKRLEAVIQYVSNQTKCRSRQLVAYFGETESIRCGKCDVCLERNKVEMSSLEFDKILEDIKPILQKQDISIEELIDLSHYPKEKIVKIVRWLLDNNKILKSNEKKLRWNDF
jgi:ATP-dependent DNA helicase RecQ